MIGLLRQSTGIENRVICLEAIDWVCHCKADEKGGGEVGSSALLFSTIDIVSFCQ